MANTNKSNNRPTEQFSRLGFIMAAIGSSVGLGNMWKFPYITGENGGAAFFLLFIICLVLVGLPVLLAELAIGRSGRASAASAFTRLGGGPLWRGAGLLQVLTPFLILSFYIIVVGWTFHYSILAFSGRLFASSDFGGQFDGFITSYWPIFWQVVAMIAIAWVIAKGVSSGIEKFNKILLPIMAGLLVLLMVRAITLPGASEGVAFFLRPDFSVLTPESALVALGHAFFSLSLGMGILMTYGAYVDQRQSLGSATVAIGIGDLIYALIAGLIIFPTTFSFGIAPDEGARLVFIALPAAFSAMPLGWLFGGLFFVLLAIAAITSAVSILEVPVAFAKEQWGWSRTRSAWTVAAICFAFGMPLGLSNGIMPGLVIGDKTLFDWIDFITANILLPLMGLLITIFAGFRWKAAAESTALSQGWLRLWLLALRYVAPILMLLVLLYTSGVLAF